MEERCANHIRRRWRFTTNGLGKAEGNNAEEALGNARETEGWPAKNVKSVKAMAFTQPLSVGSQF